MDSPSGPTAMVRATAVRKQYGDLVALDGIDVEVARGEVLGLLGPNGAGKTTLVRILASLLRPDAGRVEIGGVDVTTDPMAVRAMIGLAGQAAAVDDLLTGRENLEIVGRLFQLGRAEARRRAVDILDRLSLTDAADRMVKTYSGGMRRRIDLGASLVGRPRVLLLDEPTTGLDPRTRLELWRFIQDLVAGGTTVLLTTQYLEEADELADRIAVLDQGRIIAEGTPDELKERLGGDVLTVSPADLRDLPTVAAVVAQVVGTDPWIDERKGRVTVSVTDRIGSLLETGRRLEAEGTELRDLAVSRPSLDEVFLTLTGRETNQDPDEDSEQETEQRARR